MGGISAPVLDLTWRKIRFSGWPAGVSPKSAVAAQSLSVRALARAAAFTLPNAEKALVRTSAFDSPIIRARVLTKRASPASPITQAAVARNRRDSWPAIL